MDSLNEQVEKVREAFFVANTPQMEMPTETPYVCEVFDGYVIAEVDDKKYQINYATDADGVITFDPRESWVEVEEVYQPAKSDSVVNFGSEVKAVKLANGDVKLGGYLVRFSDASAPDLTGDFFTKNTDFGNATQSDGWFNHRLPVEFEGKRIRYKDELPVVELTRDNIGIFAEIVIGARNEYEKMIAELGIKGKLSWSSGTAPHLVDRKSVGSASEITMWKLGKDASLTPTPAEPRSTNNLVTIKSIQDADKAAKENIMETTENKVDVKSEVAEAVKSALAIRDAELKAEADVKAKIEAERKAAEDAGYQKAIKELADKGYKTYHTTAPTNDDNDGVGAFKAWLGSGQKNSSLIEPSSSYRSIKAAWNVADGGTGGYMVPDPLHNQVIEKRNIASWVRLAPTQNFVTPSDHYLVAAENTSMTAFVETAESTAYDENEGTVGQTDIVIKKYTKEVIQTEEFLSFQGTSFDTWMMGALGRAEAKLENTLSTTVLLASAQASGITAASATTITIANLSALIGSLNGGYNIPNETGFLTTNKTDWYLKGVFGTNYQAFDGYFNRAVYISDDMPAMTSGLRSVLYGNFNFLGIAEKPGMMIQRDPYSRMKYGEVCLYANIYRGMAVLQAEAFKTLIQGS